jgi:hypothetical protein
MKAMPWLIFFGLALAAAGIPYSYAQVPDPFTMQQMGAGRGAAPPPQQAGPGIDCNAEFQKHNVEMQKRGQAIQELSKRKGTAKDACALLRRYVSAEEGMIKFLRTHNEGCKIPPEILKQVQAGSAQSVNMRDQVCKAATQQQAAPPPPPPSQGLSGVLGGGANPGGASGGSGVFESLTGNVLRQ